MLSGYSRYLFTGFAYCVALFVIAALSAIQDWIQNCQALPGRKLGTLCLAALCVFMGQAVATGQIPIASPFKRPAYEGTRIAKVDRAVSFETRGASTVVYCHCPREEDKDYIQAILQYKLYSPMRDLTMIFDADGDADHLWGTVSRHEVLVVVDEDEFIGQVIARHWQERETYVGTYLLEYAH